MDHVSKRYFCNRCRTSFSSAKYYAAHIGYSINHNVCHLCPDRRDFQAFASLQRHLEDFHLYCEPCHWFAPSAIGLRQHNTSRHFLCIACGDYFPNAHELNGHAFKHRPRGVYCYCCPQDFSTLSAMFNHLESGNCSSGIEHDDILALAATFVRSLSPSQGYVFFCIGCRKPFRRMCDLLQHSETSSCDEGYWKGSGHVGSLVTYIASHISELVPEVDGGDMETGHNSPDNDPDKTPRPKFNIPTIVITGPT